MSKLYKLTDQDGKTRTGQDNETQWGPGVTHAADGKSQGLCNEHWIHAYRDPHVAALLNPAHADLRNPKLWECEGTVGLDMADKCGCTELTTVREIPLPKMTVAQKVEFARLVALRVYPLWWKYDKNRTVWKWLNGDKSISAEAAAWAADEAAAWAAWAAARAAWAAWAADEAAAWAAWAACEAADGAVAAGAGFTWRKLRNDAHKACGVTAAEEVEGI